MMLFSLILNGDTDMVDAGWPALWTGLGNGPRGIPQRSATGGSGTGPIGRGHSLLTWRCLPMFPLGSVLLPGAVLPLHVFEPRYRQLVKDCLAGEPEFGVALIDRGARSAAATSAPRSARSPG